MLYNHIALRLSHRTSIGKHDDKARESHVLEIYDKCEVIVYINIRYITPIYH